MGEERDGDERWLMLEEASRSNGMILGAPPDFVTADEYSQKSACFSANLAVFGPFRCQSKPAPETVIKTNTPRKAVINANQLCFDDWGDVLGPRLSFVLIFDPVTGLRF